MSDLKLKPGEEACPICEHAFTPADGQLQAEWCPHFSGMVVIKGLLCPECHKIAEGMGVVGPNIVHDRRPLPFEILQYSKNKTSPRMEELQRSAAGSR